ncbi:NAD(P)/FAD-dependent oxidoreductase [Vitreoscilla stercoraria]|uniref:FAD-binding oxidoreductase n=1 Tax=Vitreoscilla stercoraria TaxID=61 RepID=A0ABY4ED14_VITST|nr:FAD-dependent oxidoreductase [Vitreoscilla stercoraria]UOO93624.1 FAD-binding oxidoreductase [Vitreoscilla stercoraria]
MLEQDNISFWVKSAVSNGHYQDAQIPPPLHGQSQFDVAIIGGGFTGLWLAYYLKKAQPEWSIAIFEANQIAYGASGRNGGWLSSHIPGLSSVFQKSGSSLDDVRLFQKEITRTVDEVKHICQLEDIDCDLYEGGMLTMSTNRAQSYRLRETYKHDLDLGFDTDDMVLLTGLQVKEKINVAHADSGLWYRKGARIQPAKLAFGLKNVLSQLGVFMYENTPVSGFSPKHVQVAGFHIQADHVMCCTEGYTEALVRSGKVVPMNSSVIATEILPDSFWQQANWHGRELFSDASHLFFYAQRTEDNRIVIGGRGKPYQYNSQTVGHGELDRPTLDFLYGRLTQLFPYFPMKIEHSWRGSFGLTRDWCPSVSYDSNTQIGSVYGFGGSGVAGTNLAARTLCSRILKQDTALNRLPWNNFINPKWEPEPLRWTGIHTMYKLLKIADAKEHTQKPDKTTWLARQVYGFCGIK